MNDIIENEYSPELMRSQFEVLRDFALHYPGAFPVLKPTDVIIIEAEDDKMFPPSRRKNLRSLLPGVKVKTFRQGGHLLAITRRDEYITEVRDFIAADYPAQTKSLSWPLFSQ